MTAIDIFGNPPCRNLNDVLSIPAGIARLRIRLGWEGYGVYCAIIDMLATYKKVAFPADYELVAFKISADVKIVRSVIEDFGLFCKEKTDLTEYFYSPALRNLNERLLNMHELLAAPAAKGRVGRPARNTQNIQNPQSTQNTQNIQNTQSTQNYEKAQKSDTCVMPKKIVERQDTAEADGSFDLGSNLRRLMADSDWLSKVAKATGVDAELMSGVFELFAEWRIGDGGEYATEEEMTAHLINWIRKGCADRIIKKVRDDLKARRDHERREAERARVRRERDEHARSTVTYADYCRARGIESTGSIVADVMKIVDANRSQV